MKIFSRFHYVWYLVSASIRLEVFVWCGACDSVTVSMSACGYSVCLVFLCQLKIFPLRTVVKSMIDSFVFLSVWFSCCLWHFRRWQMLTLYQTTATFVPGGRPPYVVDASISIRVVCCNPTLVSPSSPLQHIIKRLQCLWRYFHLCYLINTCISADVFIACNILMLFCCSSDKKHDLLVWRQCFDSLLSFVFIYLNVLYCNCSHFPVCLKCFKTSQQPFSLIVCVTKKYQKHQPIFKTKE